MMPQRTVTNVSTSHSSLVGRIDYTDGQMRQRSEKLLFCGTICGLLGFFFAFWLGFWEMAQNDEANYLGEPFASGHNYFPETVSEMVYDQDSPHGKCFFAFCLIGAIAIFQSWYPWELRNVYIGDDARILQHIVPDDWWVVNFLPRWVTLRQFLPPVGMMIVACIPTTPAVNADARDKITVLLHTLGAVLMIGGYTVIELYTLFIAKNVHFHGGPRGHEFRSRFVIIVLCCNACFFFVFFGVLRALSNRLGLCCPDTWKIPTLDDALHALESTNLENRTRSDIYVKDLLYLGKQKYMLVDTASGAVRFVKAGEYFAEVLAGLFMIASHLCIWWYCPERHLDLAEELPDPGRIYSAQPSLAIAARGAGEVELPTTATGVPPDVPSSDPWKGEF